MVPWPAAVLQHQPLQWHSPSWPSRSIQLGSKASLIGLSSSSCFSVAQGCIQRPKQVLWPRSHSYAKLSIIDSLRIPLPFPVVPHLGPQTWFGFDGTISPHSLLLSHPSTGCSGFLRDSWGLHMIWMCAVKSLSQGWFSLADESWNVTGRLISQHRFSWAEFATGHGMMGCLENKAPSQWLLFWMNLVGFVKSKGILGVKPYLA